LHRRGKVLIVPYRERHLRKLDQIRIAHESLFALRNARHIPRDLQILRRTSLRREWESLWRPSGERGGEQSRRQKKDCESHAAYRKRHASGAQKKNRCMVE
jgi:hypothetical protein